MDVKTVDDYSGTVCWANLALNSLIDDTSAVQQYPVPSISNPPVVTPKVPASEAPTVPLTAPGALLAFCWNIRGISIASVSSQM